MSFKTAKALKYKVATTIIQLPSLSVANNYRSNILSMKISKKRAKYLHG